MKLNQYDNLFIELFCKPESTVAADIVIITLSESCALLQELLCKGDTIRSPAPRDVREVRAFENSGTASEIFGETVALRATDCFPLWRVFLPASFDIPIALVIYMRSSEKK